MIIHGLTFKISVVFLKLHMHTRSLISAALYINVDEKSSPLFL